MANKKDDGYWFSLENGKHVHVGKGETPKEATEKALNKTKSNSSKQKGVKREYDKYDEWGHEITGDFDKDLAEAFKKYGGDEDAVLDELRSNNKNYGMSNGDIQGAVEVYAMTGGVGDEFDDDEFDNDYDSDFDEWEKENPNFVDEIDETDFEKVEKNEKINGSKAKNPNRKDKYGNELVSDEAFKIGQKGVKTYLDFMTQYDDLESLKQSRIFMGGLQKAASKAITEAGFDPNYDLTYQDHNEIIGSVLGEEVDTAAYESGDSIGFTNRKYNGYQPSSSQNQTEEEPKEDKNNTPDELNKIFNDLTKKYNMSEDDYWKLVRTIEKMNKSFGNKNKEELSF